MNLLLFLNGFKETQDFLLECAIWKPPELDEFPPLTVYKTRRKVSKRTSKTYDGSRPSRKLVASLEQIGQYNENTGKWEGMKWYHYLELKLALQLGCKIIGVGQTLWFEQRPVIKSYAEKIQKLRITSKSESMKTFCKKLGNANYGSMAMNKRKQCESKIFRTTKEFNRIRVSTRIKRFHRISNGWHYASLEKEKLDLDNPIGIGATIPAIGKYLMWKWIWRLKKIYRRQYETDPN